MCYLLKASLQSLFKATSLWVNLIVGQPHSGSLLFDLDLLRLYIMCCILILWEMYVIY